MPWPAIAAIGGLISAYLQSEQQNKPKPPELELNRAGPTPTMSTSAGAKVGGPQETATPHEQALSTAMNNPTGTGPSTGQPSTLGQMAEAAQMRRTPGSGEQQPSTGANALQGMAMGAQIAQGMRQNAPPPPSLRNFGSAAQVGNTRPVSSQFQVGPRRPQTLEEMIRAMQRR